MFQRCLALSAVLAFLMLAGRAAAEEKMHEGKIVKAGKGTISVTDKDGKNMRTYVVKPGTPVSMDGKECKLDDLTLGSSVKVWTKDDPDKTVTRVEARKSTDGK
jgi:hypothetical protein